MEMFIAVKVAGGRLFKGDAYRIPGEYTTRYGYAGSGVCPLTFTDKVKVWDPITGRASYVNERFVESREVTDEQYKADFAKYADGVITSTVEWCRSKDTTKPEAEVVKFAFAVIRKNHPDMVPAFEAKYGFKEDVAASVRSTIAWAMGLGYRRDKATYIAYRALTKKGLLAKPEGKAAWTATCESLGVTKWAAKYVAA